MPHYAPPAPDARIGGGHGTLGGHMGSFKQNDLWPYKEPPDAEQDDDLDDIANDLKIRGDEPNIDQLNRSNYRTHSYVNGSTRGLTGIMAGAIRLGDLIEALAGAIGQASPSYNVTGPDGTTRTRPGRMTGSKRGYFSPHIPKNDDPELQAYSLEDIAKNQQIAPMAKSAIAIKKIKAAQMHKLTGNKMKNSHLRAYIRDILGDL